MLEQHAEVLGRCTFCHDQCAFACPVFTSDRRTTVYPSRKAQIAWTVKEGQLPLNEETARIFYQCTSCRLCWRWCVYLKERQDLTPALRAARATAVEQGVLLLEVAALAERTKAEGTPYGDLRPLHAALVKEAPQAGEERVLLFADAATLAFNPDAVRAFFALAAAAGLAVDLTANLLTGFELADVGLNTLARAVREEAVRELMAWSGQHKDGVIVTLNPQVAYALTAWYGEEGASLALPVRTLSQLAADLISAGRLRLEATSERAVFQDSSYQVRYLEDTASPRRVLHATYPNLVEASPSGTEANPAAAEGLAPELSTSFKEKMAAQRLRELLAVGPAVIITADPFSYQVLSKAALGEVLVQDLAQAVAARL